MNRPLLSFPALVFLLAIAYCLATVLYSWTFHWIDALIFFAVTMAICWLVLRSWSLIIEASVIILAWALALYFGCRDALFMYLPLAVFTIVAAARPVLSRATALFTLAASLLLFYAGNKPVFEEWTWVHAVFLLCAAATLAIHLHDAFSKTPAAPQFIDFILCSYSGNTAHYANLFIHGLREGGASVTIHRFHYYNDFDPALPGDALAIAFPVFGWKPPWPLVEYILKKLPRGKGKPVYIVYSSGGGPENTSFVAWLLLTLKGYRVAGRLTGVYPINVVTFRIGPKNFWKRFDSWSPMKDDSGMAVKAGMQYAQAQRSGFPTAVWPFPLVIIGFALDNKFLNTYLYRNKAWKRRCIQCGLCVNFCPSGRLYMKDGYPAARGTCALCLGCINLCPRNAMHLMCFSEYGNQYKPKWPELVIKKKETT